MKKVLTILSACFVSIAAYAQNNIVVKYDITNRDSDKGDLVKREMTLLSNNQKSLYFNPMSLYVDSCESTPEGKAKLREIQMKAWRVVHPDGSVTLDGRKFGLAPDKNEFLYVKKDVINGIMSVFDYKAGGMWRYEETMEEMSWTIVEDSILNILDMECVMSETDYHGRHWKVWFSPELPVQDGPWKLHGLPGVILKADGGDDFLIVAKEIGSSFMNIPEVYSESKYEKGNRLQILADHEHYINNFESMMGAQGIKMNADGSPANLRKYDRQHQAWETDYR